MCGIAGALAFGGGDAGRSDEQLRCMAHRGPDADGVFARGQGWVGQTRLSIIDLARGDPPIANEAGTIGVALNGEIYNYRELRAGLRARGHTLATDGDTEVIAHLAEELAPAALATALEGMFAIAAWDEPRGRLVLARDRFGKKPLYYFHDGHRLVFGSEIKSVLAHPHVPRELRADVIPDYLTFGYVPAPDTFYAGIRQVPPGHVLVAGTGGEVRLERYWEPRWPGADAGVARAGGTWSEQVAEVRRLLRAAVRRRLVAHVPLGAFLSGGIDSSAVVGLMSETAPAPVRTFTIGFEGDDGFDERPFARAVAERHGTDHTEFVVKPDAAALLERLVWHHDQPFGDSSALPTYLLSELTRRHVTVALCGDGGDELFAGYERFAAALALARYARAVPRAARTALARRAEAAHALRRRRRGAKLRRALMRSDLNAPQGLLAWVSYVSAEDRRALAGPARGRGEAEYERIWERSAGAHPLDRLLDLNLRTYLLDDLLPKVDRMAMAHGLEVRSPFLDRELAEYAFTLAPSARLRVRDMALKRILKTAVADLLPPGLLDRPKQGFGVPLDRWFRTDLAPLVDGLLCAPDARVAGHLSHAAVRAMAGAHRRGAANHGHALWTLLTLETFLRREAW
jgi:asparagine synthase (glutamine-hydrolysing)